MTYNSALHHRRSIRLSGYDYSQAGAYFITICTQNRECIFGEIEASKMKLNELGHIAYNMWMEMPGRYPIRLDVFQIMPNHIHAIIIVGAPLAGARLNIANTGAGASPAPTIGDVIGAYKSMVANECLKWFKSKDTFMGKIWQRNYYEHIIRDDAELDRIREYIAGNPARWAMDEENPNRMECEQQSQARLM